MRKYLLLLLSVFLFLIAFPQSKDDSVEIDIGKIKYEEVTEDNYEGFKNPKLIVDYYFSDGISYGDRYSYEIILIDSLLMFGFSSPETEDYNYISYQKKLLLGAGQVKSVKAVIESAGIKQLKKGIPRPDASAHTKEVLVIKYKDKHIDITGGMFHHVIFEDNISTVKMNREIALERKLTSSIGGDYDKVFMELKKYFVDLNDLIKQAKKTE